MSLSREPAFVPIDELLARPQAVPGDSIADVPAEQRPFLADLVRRKEVQVSRFLALRPRFWDVVRGMGEPPAWFASDMWANAVRDVSHAWPWFPPVGFLRHPVVHDMMHASGTASWVQEQADFLRRSMPEARLAELLDEDPVGYPLVAAGATTSHQSIHTLTHLVRWIRAMNVERFPTFVVEWGGGYGSFAKMYLRLGGMIDKAERTYVLLDLPLVAGLQWLYLSSVLGEDHVVVATETTKRGWLRIARGKVNVVPAHLCGLLGPRAELFVSTWALSESPSKTQELVARLRWFGAPQMLLAHQIQTQRIPDASRMLTMLPRPFHREPCGYVPNNWYVFR